MSEGVQEENGPHFRGPFLDEFHLGILIPSGSTWETGFALSLVQVVEALHAPRIARNQSYYIRNMQTSLLPYSREDLVWNAMHAYPQTTHFLFLDSDMTFPADTVHWLAYRRKPIVISNYTRRTVPAVPIARHLDGRFVVTDGDSVGLERVRYGGLGVALFERAVFDQVPRPWFGLRWREDGATPGHPKMDGEDTWLFDKCTEHGHEVLVDHDLSQHIGHIGKFEYTTAMIDRRDFEEEEAANVARIAGRA